jgi:epoxyqueuosine reductase
VTQAAEFQPRTFPHPTNGQSTESAATFTERQEEESLFLPRLEWLAAMSENQFRTVFRGSPVKRTKWRGLVRNACIALGNSTPSPGTTQHGRISELLTQLSASREPLIAESAQWALSRIQ